LYFFDPYRASFPGGFGNFYGYIPPLLLPPTNNPYPFYPFPPEGFRQSKQSPFPPVDVKQFEKSANKFLQLMKEANLFITKIIEFPGFARELMTAAQMSNENKVLELIKSTGIAIPVRTSFTPDSIRITFENADKPGKCCHLLMTMKW